MADTIDVKCPKCSKAMSVPAKLAGRKVRCKGCETVVPVPVAKGKETFKLVEEEPRQKKPEPPKKPVDLEEDANPYAAQADDSHVVRCAFCAKPLDPPDARICKECGFDRIDRYRHEQKKVFELTFGEYLGHHAITIGAFLCILILIGISVTCYIMMPEWFKGSMFETGDKNPINDEPKYYVNPGFFTLWIVVGSLFLSYYAGKFIYRMLRYNWRPTELRTSG